LLLDEGAAVSSLVEQGRDQAKTPLMLAKEGKKNDWQQCVEMLESADSAAAEALKKREAEVANVLAVAATAAGGGGGGGGGKAAAKVVRFSSTTKAYESPPTDTAQLLFEAVEEEDLVLVAHLCLEWSGNNRVLEAQNMESVRVI